MFIDFNYIVRKKVTVFTEVSFGKPILVPFVLNSCVTINFGSHSFECLSSTLYLTYSI